MSVIVEAMLGTQSLMTRGRHLISPRTRWLNDQNYCLPESLEVTEFVLLVQMS